MSIDKRLHLETGLLYGTCTAFNHERLFRGGPGSFLVLFVAIDLTGWAYNAQVGTRARLLKLANVAATHPCDGGRHYGTLHHKAHLNFATVLSETLEERSCLGHVTAGPGDFNHESALVHIQLYIEVGLHLLNICASLANHHGNDRRVHGDSLTIAIQLIDFPPRSRQGFREPANFAGLVGT